ncbi:hypothetical protein BGZ60DRAFT_496652 [Tricladium varicosporioides]|nr:hypothetical protein BGZ60DRAFT_496652 [Hymenoscyphus varicosporioides]
MSGPLPLPKNYVPLVVTLSDIKLASLAWGFTLGVGALTCWKALKQTQRIVRTKRLRSIYVWMIWGEILACLIFGIICWLHLNGNIPPSFGFYFGILTCWSLQVQFLLQIIINRVGIIEPNTRRITILKWSVAAMVTSINISVYCIWIPARMQISPEYISINDKWDRCEKVIYLLIDGYLNYRFISTVKENLVKMGLEKYRSLMHVNIAIVMLSLSMDVLIIGMMSLKNTFVYCQFHPLAYIVKLHIELHLAELIASIAQRKDHITNAFPDSNPEHHHSSAKTFPIPLDHLPPSNKHHDIDFQPRDNIHSHSHGQGIMKTQDVSVETYSIGKESTTSGEVGDLEGGFGRSGSGLASSSTVVGGCGERVRLVLVEMKSR